MQTELDSADLSVCSTGAWFDPGCSVYVIMNRKMFGAACPFFRFSPLLPLFFLLGLPLPPHHKLVYTCPLLATHLAKPPRKTQTKTPTKPPTKTQTKPWSKPFNALSADFLEGSCIAAHDWPHNRQCHRQRHPQRHRQRHRQSHRQRRRQRHRQRRR